MGGDSNEKKTEGGVYAKHKGRSDSVSSYVELHTSTPKQSPLSSNLLSSLSSSLPPLFSSTTSLALPAIRKAIREAMLSFGVSIVSTLTSKGRVSLFYFVMRYWRLFL